jgi:hypothetical protein
VVVLETNTLVALGSVSLALGVGLAVLCILCAVASIVCYQRFYALEAAAAFVDGSIPLVLAVVMTGALAICAG